MLITRRVATGLLLVPIGGIASPARRRRPPRR